MGCPSWPVIPCRHSVRDVKAATGRHELSERVEMDETSPLRVRLPEVADIDSARSAIDASLRLLGVDLHNGCHLHLQEEFGEDWAEDGGSKARHRVGPLDPRFWLTNWYCRSHQRVAPSLSCPAIGTMICAARSQSATRSTTSGRPTTRTVPAASWWRYGGAQTPTALPARGSRPGQTPVRALCRQGCPATELDAGHRAARDGPQLARRA